MRAVALAGAVGGLLLFNSWAYFGRVPYDPRVWDAFSYTAESAIGRTIQTGRCAGPVLVPQAMVASDALRYLTYGRTVEPFDLSSPPTPLPSGACLFMPADLAPAQRERLAQRLGVPPPLAPWRYPGTDTPVFWLYQMP
ncbi:MAG: hypothetical protein WCG26_12645 [Chloroflexales bacterium]